MTKQGRLLLLRLTRCRWAAGFKRARPLCPYEAQAPSFYTSFKSKHAVLHHSCFGQIKVSVLIINFCHYTPSALTNCPVGRVPVHLILSYIIPNRAALCLPLFCCSFSRLLLLSQEPLGAIKESSGLGTLNIDLLSRIYQRSTANMPVSGHLTPPPHFFLQEFVMREKGFFFKKEKNVIGNRAKASRQAARWRFTWALIKDFWER